MDKKCLALRSYSSLFFTLYPSIYWSFYVTSSPLILLYFLLVYVACDTHSEVLAPFFSTFLKNLLKWEGINQHTMNVLIKSNEEVLIHGTNNDNDSRRNQTIRK